MRDKPKLQVTKDYSIFEMHHLNRDLAKKPILYASMKAHGFMPSSPLQCMRNGSGKLKVVKGHHRLEFAKQLKLPVWYVVDNSNTDIYDLEGDSSVRWTIRDFLTSRANAGDQHCAKVLAFQQKHGITQGAAISLIAGESASSQNKMVDVKRGTFKAGSDLSHAEAVVDVTDHFRRCGVAFATQASFVGAVSMVLRVKDCDPEILKRRVSKRPAMVKKRTSVDGYLEELEALYNHASKSVRVPLEFMAREAGRQRQATFGGNRNVGRPRARRKS
jgi:hypothetical protein